MGVVEDVSPKLRAQRLARELGWEGEFVRYSEQEIAYRDRVAELRNQTDGPVNPKRRRIHDVVAFTAEVKQQARRLGAGLVGVCEVDQDYVYANRSAPERYAICLAMPMDYGQIQKAPSDAVGAEVYRVYELIASAAVRLGGFIREQGYPARAQVVGRYDIMLVPHARAAGLGEQCRIGVLASAEYGPCMRLAAVVTDAPLAVDLPVDLGVAGVCDGCEICRKVCPGNAIPEKRARTRGVEKWTLDPVGCMRWLYYNPEGCTLCLKACPLCESPEALLKKLAATG